MFIVPGSQLHSIIQYLEKNDPIALQSAKKVMECFEPYSREEGQTYSRASALATELCDKEVVHLMTEIQFKVESYNSDAENVMSTEQNAYVVRNAEKYFQAMIKRGATSGTSTWFPPGTHEV